MDSATRSFEFIRSLEKGLAVITSFSRDRSVQTAGEVADHLGISRSAARRILLTLARLGFADRAGGGFKLTCRVLDLGYPDLSWLRIPEIARHHMERLVNDIGESSSMSVLDGTEIVHVAQVPSKRRFSTVALDPGTRLPAHATAAGRVLLASLLEEEFEEYLSEVELTPLTPHTITDRSILWKRIEEVRAEGFALVDQELEIGLRSVAAPVTSSEGFVIAAVDISCDASRVSVSKLKAEFIPKLVATAEEISIGSRHFGQNVTPSMHMSAGSAPLGRRKS